MVIDGNWQFVEIKSERYMVRQATTAWKSDISHQCETYYFDGFIVLDHYLAIGKPFNYTAEVLTAHATAAALPTSRINYGITQSPKPLFMKCWPLKRRIERWQAQSSPAQQSARANLMRKCPFWNGIDESRGYRFSEHVLSPIAVPADV